MSLIDADRTASNTSGTDLVGAPVTGCPLTEFKERIEVQVLGEDNVGIPAIAVVLARGNGEQLGGVSAPDGVVMFEGLDPGSYQLSLTELDQDAWVLCGREPLTGAAAISHAKAAWGATAVAPADEFIHTIVQGECISQIGEAYGFFPDTIWRHGANASLRAQRTSLYILAPGDRVVIPPKRPKQIAAASGHRFFIRRKGVPERLRVRFLRHDDTPRAGVPYLLSVEMPDGCPIAGVQGQTDAGGFVDAAIPPGATSAEIVLGPTDEQEVHRFDLGHVDPIDSISGWQARLNNLGYDCGARDGILNERTRHAICAFQRAVNVPVSGAIDAATTTALQRMALS